MTEIMNSEKISLNRKVNLLNRATKVLIEWHVEGCLLDLHDVESIVTMQQLPNNS